MSIARDQCCLRIACKVYRLRSPQSTPAHIASTSDPRLSAGLTVTDVSSPCFQVYGVARQMLSLVAGGAIDEYILSQLKALRQEHQLARLIHSLQISLWPGGVWFQRTPGRQPPVCFVSFIACEENTMGNELLVSQFTMHIRSKTAFNSHRQEMQLVPQAELSSKLCTRQDLRGIWPGTILHVL